MNYLQCVVLEGWHKSGYSKTGETVRTKVLISFVMYALEAKRMLCRETGSITKRWLNYCLSAHQFLKQMHFWVGLLVLLE